MFELFAPFLSSDFIGKLVRTGVQTVSGGLVTNGMITGDQQQQLGGALALIASLVWTAFAHSKAVAKYASPPNPSIGGLK